MTEPIFSSENRNRLIYLVGDLLRRPRINVFGQNEGADDFFVLDELLRRRLATLQLIPGVNAPDSILRFIQTAPEDELFDMIELIPAVPAKSTGFGYVEASFQAREIRSKINEFLKNLGSSASFQHDGSFDRDSFEAKSAEPLRRLPKKEDLESDLQALLAQPGPTGLLLLDLDGFKAINEKNGYPAGDRCLEKVVALLSEAILRKGKLYRFREGDEFAVILRNSTVTEVASTAERIRGSIEDGDPGEGVAVTASIGVASSGKNDLDTVERLLAAAEEALHVSKHTTKNCVTAWPIPSDLRAEVRRERESRQGR